MKVKWQFSSVTGPLILVFGVPAIAGAVGVVRWLVGRYAGVVPVDLGFGGLTCWVERVFVERVFGV